MGKEEEGSVKNKHLKTVYILCATIILVALSLFNLSLYFTKGKPERNKKVLGTEIVVYREIYYWKGLLEANPQYLEGWLELAKIEYSIGNYEEAKNAVSKASEIDPNSEELKKVRKLVNF